MMTPTKVWTFDDVYSITVIGGNKMNAKVMIDWACGQALYDRACIDMLESMTVLTSNGWTASECIHERVESRIDDEPAMKSFSIVNQFVDEDESWRLAAEFAATLKDASGLP